MNASELCAIAKSYSESWIIDWNQITQIVFSVLCLAAIIINLPIKCLKRDPVPMHKNLKIILYNAMFTYIFHAISNITVQITHQIKYHMYADPCVYLIPYWQCIAMKFGMYSGVIGFTLFHVMLSFERTLAVLYPSRYETTGSKIGIIGSVLMWILISGWCVYMYYGEDLSQPFPYCFLTTTTNSVKWIIEFIFLLAVDIVVLIVDIVITIVNNKSLKNNAYQLKENSRTMKLILPISIVHSIFLLLFFSTTLTVRYISFRKRIDSVVFNGFIEISNTDINNIKNSAVIIADKLANFGKLLRDTELPNDVKSIEQLMESHTLQQHAIKENFRLSIQEGCTLLKHAKQTDTKFGSDRLEFLQVHNINAIEKMLIQLEDTEKSFDLFWEKHKQRLMHSMHVRQFEESFRQIQINYNKHRSYLENYSNGDKTLDTAVPFINQEDYTKQFMTDIRFGIELIQSGKKLITSQNSEHNSSLIPKFEELEKIINSLNILVDIHNQNFQTCSKKMVNTKVQCVINELITTEKTYVHELRSIVDYYIIPFESPERIDYIPNQIRGQTELIFGNIREILVFHEQSILNKMLDYLEDPIEIFHILINQRNNFLYIYRNYCQNKSHGEAIRKEFVDGNPFFMECQQNAGHLLPLSSYLLKPIQRITKYQLLLKEMLKNCSNEMKHDLQAALASMLDLLAQLNSDMHQLHILGFIGDLRLLGPLRMQTECDVIQFKRKSHKLSNKIQRRCLFLFDGGILFCKKRTQQMPLNLEYYEFKLCIPMQNLELATKNSPNRFEIWNRTKNEGYEIYIANENIRDKWIQKIVKTKNYCYITNRSNSNTPNSFSNPKFDNALSRPGSIESQSYSSECTTPTSSRISSLSDEFCKEYHVPTNRVTLSKSISDDLVRFLCKVVNVFLFSNVNLNNNYKERIVDDQINSLSLDVSII